ncbi:disulfide bond formation protein DsbB [Rodentibacter caecimuris]|uniref:Disulfide bond formation protein B n=1 Tax=Rodentibacter caecimuris TaxID=1796644 RepID=A0ABX3KWB7_9PAST|nr:disulfide bond formation protein B [Rodentibacter heylii]
MLRFLKQFSFSRFSWGLLAVSALALELIALYFQYGLNLKPCVLCVYERLAICGLICAGIIGCIYPKGLILRLTALIVGLISALWGGIISLRHLDLQMNPVPWKQCEFLPNFPETLPFHQWFPFLFSPTGSCNESQWDFLGLTMVQWLVVIFSIYTLALLAFFFSQFIRYQTPRRLFK